MKLLIDECVDERHRFLFPGHECQTARFARPEHSRPTESDPRKYRPGDPLWADQPVEGARNPRIRSDFRS
jgi:hypothetical protein